MNDGDHVDMADPDFIEMLESMIRKRFDRAYTDDHLTSFYLLLDRYLINRRDDIEAPNFRAKHYFYGYLKRLAQIHFYHEIHNGYRKDKWLITERQLIASKMRRAEQHGGSSTDYIDTQLGSLRPTDSGEESFIIAHDLDMMLSHLAPDERHLIDLVSQGLRHIDVARLMGWKDNTTFVKIKRLRDKIKGIWIEGYA